MLKGYILLVIASLCLLGVYGVSLSSIGFKAPSEYLPIPANAAPFAPNQPNGLYVGELEKDVFFVSDTAYTFCIVDIGESLVVIDSPPTVGADRLLNVTKTIRKNKKVSHYIYTHAHQDHIGLAGSFTNSKKIKYIAHELTAKLLKRAPNMPKPTIILKEKVTKKRLGNKNFVFHYYGNSHAEGNVLIWLPKSKVVINIDIVFPQWAPFYGLGVTQDAIRYIEQYKIVMSFNFKHFITGHLGRTATKADLSTAYDFILDMKAIAEDGIKTFNNITAYYAKFGGNNTAAVNHWAVLHNWEGDMATHCAETLINKYKDVVAGIDVYSWSNCWFLRENLALFYSGLE